MQATSEEKTSALFSADSISRYVHELAAADRHATAAGAAKPSIADRRLWALIDGHDGRMRWIDYRGTNEQAEVLLQRLHEAEQEGLPARYLLTAAVERDARQLHQLLAARESVSAKADATVPADSLLRVAARLEYRLTKACLRYAYGQRYGYVNPRQLLNHLDMEPRDSLHPTVRYRQLFDVDVEQPTDDFADRVLTSVSDGTLQALLDDIQPRTAVYDELRQMLRDTTLTQEDRQRVYSNMERARWRGPSPKKGEKRVVVNIPAFKLYAYDADSVLSMRIACGARTTKTPLLVSAVEWMEVNPEWIIPRSILEKDVAPRAGDSAYFARNRYRIFERATNRQMDVAEVTRAMLLSGRYRVAQESGNHNSLGRIVFRFKNSFAVFLHYTSTPGVFQREVRAVSHGCVRVERPFELARFVLDEPDEWLLDRIHISMGLGALTQRGRRFVADHPADEDQHLVSYVPVRPHVPIYIMYQTLWPDGRGRLQSWPDVYGYDRVLLSALGSLAE